MKFPRKENCSARPQPGRVRGRVAFTLIEIMVAIAIFMLVIAAIYSTWELVMRATKVGQDAAAQAQRRRIALRTIEDSLMCIQSFQASHQYYSFIVVNGDTPLLSFASRLPEIFPRNGKFGDFNLRRLTFTLETGTDGEKNLVLRQNPILMDLDLDEKKDPLILARNVQKFTIECWDTNQLEWMDEWSNTNSIPPMVRVGLVLGGNVEAGGTAPKMSVMRAFSMPSAMMPAMVQTGGAGGFPGASGIQLTPPGKNNSAPGGQPVGAPAQINPNPNQPPGNYPRAGGPGIIPPASFGR